MAGKGKIMGIYTNVSVYAFYFKWSIIDLQYYMSFRITAEWFSTFTDYTQLKVITR